MKRNPSSINSTIDITIDADDDNLKKLAIPEYLLHSVYQTVPEKGVALF
jgi:hypothetical protein